MFDVDRISPVALELVLTGCGAVKAPVGVDHNGQPLPETAVCTRHAFVRVEKRRLGYSRRRRYTFVGGAYCFDARGCLINIAPAGGPPEKGVPRVLWDPTAGSSLLFFLFFFWPWRGILPMGRGRFTTTRWFITTALSDATPDKLMWSRFVLPAAVIALENFVGGH